METPANINLTEEKETLFITLYAKALDYRAKRSILHDSFADELVKKLNVDVSKYRGFGNSVIVVRARQLDEWIKQFIAENPQALVLYLGCGLDTRIQRIDPPATVSWFDLDYPEVMAVRRLFYADREGYRMMAASITDAGWLEQLPANRPTLVVAEGVLEYLTEEEVKTLLNRLTAHFKQGEVVFDVMNSFAIQSGRQKLKESTGAVHKWAVNNVVAVDKLNPKLKRVEELPLFQSHFIKKLPLGLRLFLKLAALMPQFKTMLRLLRYRF